MQFIKRKLREMRKRTKNKSYILYVYEVSDELGNLQEVTSLQKFTDGERVELWFDHVYNSPKIKKKKH